MGNFFTQAGSLLIETLFGIYILMVLLRFLFQLTRADFYNPFSQFIVKITNPLLLPLRRVIPGFGGIDVASVVLLLLLQMLKIFLLAAIGGFALSLALIAIFAVFQLLQMIIWVFIIAIFIRIIASWIAPYSRHPVMDLLYSLTEPLMRPARRLIPTISGIDLSPIAVLLALQILLLFVNNLLPTITAAVR